MTDNMKATLKEPKAKEAITIPTADHGIIRVQPDGFVETIDTCEPPCVTRIMSGEDLLAIVDALAKAKKAIAKLGKIELPELPEIYYGAEVFLVDGNNNKVRGSLTFEDLHIHIGCSHISNEDLDKVEAAVRKQLDR